MDKVKILRDLVIILTAVCLFAGVEYYMLCKETKSLRIQVAAQQMNGKVFNFNKMFIEKVLKADSEVSFEDRLKLENAVRDLNDPQILSQWQKFSNCKTGQEAQAEVKNLLDLLATKITY